MISEESRKRYSEAMSKRHANTPPEVRSAWMSVIAKRKWQDVSPEDRRAHAMKRVKARNKKDVKIK